MTQFAILFPGQGSQQPGMAIAWQAQSSFSRWQEASDILGWDVLALGTTADEETLRQPDHCQIALFVHQAVIYDAWRSQTQNDIQPALVAGHSLGEYNALYAAGILTFDDALRLVDVRARATMDAARARPGTMIATLGFEREQVQAATKEAGSFMANENAPGQITVSGSTETLERTKNLLSECSGRVVDVAVGAAYHSPHMEGAVEVLGQALDAANWHEATLPVVANVNALLYAPTDQANWPQLLRDQLVNPVLWLDSMHTMLKADVTTFYEMGATTPLSNMLKRVDRKAVRTPITKPEDIH